ncbi:MAG: 30S ribosomal protein S6, partial [Deltaproteobacteria bacterium]|nr:30S ribosomal protein S6 [Deltaproteobacteria bacterium]
MHPRRYETLILLSPNLSPPALETFKAKVEGILSDGGAKIVRFEDWGRRSLAYPVSKELHGQYVLYDYQAQPAVEAELKRNLKIHDSVFKHLTLVLDHKFTDDRFEDERARLIAKSQKKEADEAREAEAREREREREGEGREDRGDRDREGRGDRDRDRGERGERDRDRGGRDRDRDRGGREGRGGRDRDRFRGERGGSAPPPAPQAEKAPAAPAAEAPRPDEAAAAPA